jgi:hypothetical protein
MTPVRLSARRGIVLDGRGEGRALRVTWHHEAAVAVVSVWRDDRCAGTVHVAADDVPALIAVLAEGLAEGYRAGASRIDEAS